MENILKNILFITSRADIGGGPIQMNHLIENIDDDYRIYIACPYDGQMYDKWKENEKIVKLFELPFRKFSIKSLLCIIHYFGMNSKLIIHSHGKGAGVFSRLLKTIMWNSRVIHTFHGLGNILYSNSIIDKIRNIYVEILFSYLTSDFIAVSIGEKELAMDYLHIKEHKIRMIYNGSKKPRNVNIHTLPEKYLIVTISRFSPEKNMDFVYQVAKSLKHLDFLWIGEGETKDSIINKINLNNDRNIKNVNFNSNPFSLIHCSKPILFSASMGEGLPLTLIEAMSLGIPIVATDVIGNNELVLNSYNGYLFEPNCIREARDKILKLTENDELYCRMKNNSKEIFKANFQIANMISLTKDLYEY